MDRALNIGIISIMEGYPWGGSEELWYDMAIQAIDKGHNISISYKYWDEEPKKLTELQAKGASVFLRNSKTIYPSLAKRIVSKITGKPAYPTRPNDYRPFLNKGFDVVLINEGAFGSILHFPELYSVLLENKTPYTILSHQNKEFGCLQSSWFNLARNIYGKAKKTLFVSERNRDMSELILCQKLPNSLIVKNPVNLTDYNPIPFPESEKALLACVGRLNCAQKGQDLLLRALAQIADKFDFNLIIYGNGEDEEYLQKLSSYLGLEDKVTFAGYEPDVRKIWQNNQLLVLPSHHEGMPIVVVEAMMCGRPCFVTDVAGNSEWLKHNYSGFISPSNQVTTLRNHLLRAFENKNKWADLGNNANKSALNKISSNPGRDLLNVLFL